MLLTKSLVEDNLHDFKPWQQQAYKHLCTMFCNEENPYPCVPGKQSFSDDTLRFSFIDDPREDESITQLAKLLQYYGEISRDTGKYASFAALFDTRAVMKEGANIETFRALLWSILSRLHRLDEQPWPTNIPKDPHDQAWEFCYEGEPYFAFCATPAHSKRKSRYFPYLLIAFQPRWVFDEINGSTSLGRKLKMAIRKRLVNYDKMKPHPDLMWYGEKENYEWKQYFLSDDDSSAAQCPFMAMKNKIKSLRS
ncbi:YqcI/YcgG family protein [Bacillus solimangrovi]|uniref:YqcI/YcgG family protein n=1 Tax=Bacillus solimangrovi TaxID=1305675 RepID=A0A1E5LK32_9BACI|nr:YqcI/YcgG family protein [Bacillus solimangrovi]OEH94452.1 hypothetical protein BFG57_08305 [Bacillus solimangrovi]